MERHSYMRWAAKLAGLTAEGTATRYDRLVEQGLAPASTTQVLWEQLLVRSVDNGIDTEAFFAEARAERDDGIAFAPIEERYNLLFRPDGAPLDAILYRRLDRAPREFDRSYEIVDRGGLVSEAGLPRTDEVPVPRDLIGRAVALGIVDDALPVLHPRTFGIDGGSRFAAVWSQTLAVSSGGFGLVVGTVDDKTSLDTEIDALASARELDAYRRRALSLYGPSTRTALFRAASHGSVMLDLAGGAGPGDDMVKIPLLGVQLPPWAYDDTSGRQLGLPLVAGLRWLAVQAFGSKLCERLVVNASLGIVAGPKDGSSVIERQIQRLVEQVNSHPDLPDDALTIFFPYGNAYADNLVARRTLDPGEGFEISLRLQRDDRTPSFVELRLGPDAPMIDPANLRISLAGPQNSLFPPQTVPDAFAPVEIRNGAGEAVGDVEHIGKQVVWDEPVAPYLVIGFAPTRDAGLGGPACPAGRWRLRVENAGPERADLLAMVQRDDSPFSRKTGARQAYFDDPACRQWNRATRDFDGLGSGPITHAGTNSAYSTVASDRVFSVAGALVRGDDCRPARYSAEGADWSGGAPSLSAVSETTVGRPGVRAAGVFAAGTARRSGTSTASATAARSLALEIHSGAGLSSRPVADAEERLGARTITASDAFRDR